MKRINLVSKESIKANAYVDSNITDDTLDTAIQLAQEVNLKPVLGTALYEKITSDALAGTLDGDYKDLVDNRLQQVLTYYAIKYIIDNKFQRITESGISKEENSLTVVELRVIQGNIKSLYSSYEADLVEYLRASLDKFPEYDDVIEGEVTAEQRLASDALFDISTIQEPSMFASSTLGESSASDTYNKTEIDALLDKKLNKDLGELTPAEITTFKNTLQINNVENTADADKPLSTAAINALNVKEDAFDKNTAFNKDFGVTAGTVAEGYHTHGQYEPKNPNIQAHIADRSNPHMITPTTIGLSRVDNTYDREKPISEAQAAEFETKADKDTIPVTYLNKIEESKDESIEAAMVASEAYTDTKTGELNTALVGEINTAKNEAFAYTDTTINNLLVESAHPYPIANPASKIQRCLDSKGRQYYAKDNTSLNDWEITRREGFTGVNIGLTSVIHPKIIDNTIRFWVKFNRGIGNYTAFFQTRHDASSSDNEFRIYYVNGRVLAYYTINGSRVDFKELNDSYYDIIYSYHNNILDVWINGEHLVDSIDFSQYPLTHTSASPRFGKYSLIQEFNSKPSNEDVRTWYNTGRVDRYELPAIYKSSNSIDYNYFNELNTQEKVDKINYLIRCTKELDTIDNSLKLTGTTDGDNVPFGTYLEAMIVGELYEVSFLIKSTNTSQYPGFQSGTGIKLYEERSQLSSSYEPYRVIFKASRDVPIGVYAANAGGVNGATYNIKDFRVKRIGCLHEYLGRNIQPHKLVDTGATPEDKSLISGTTRTAEPTKEAPYQEFLSGEGAPTSVPAIPQQSYLDTTSDKLYKSTDTVSATDWELLN